MSNILVILHEGNQLSDAEERNLALSLSELTSSDKTKITITQMSQDEAISAVAGVVLSKVKKAHEVDVKHKNSKEITAAITCIVGIISLGGSLSYPTEFGRVLSVEFAKVISSFRNANDASIAFKNAIEMLSTKADEIDFEDSFCKECNFTKLHLLEIKKVHKFYSSYML